MRILAAADVRTWAHEVLLDPARERPVVAVTTRPRGDTTWIDPRAFDEAIGDRADVVLIETGDATWELADALPPRLDVYGGAVRVWWPGLTETSNPFDHRLHFAHTAEEAREVFERVVADVRARTAAAPHRNDTAVVDAIVVSVGDAAAAAPPLAAAAPEIELAAGPFRGPLRYADLPLADLARHLVPGQSLRARPVRPIAAGRMEFSVRGLLPTPWERIGAEFAVGDVFIGRVQNLTGYGAFIDVIPGVAGLVHVSEIDWSYVDRIEDWVEPGQLIAVRVMKLDPGERRLELSIKRAFGDEPRPLPSLVPGGREFRWPEPETRKDPRLSPSAPQDDAAAHETARAMSDELEALADDRARLAEQNKVLRKEIQELKKEVRSLKDRAELLERRHAHELDPLSSERAFVAAVRVAYARLFDEDDRVAHPLLRLRVGPQFLDSLRALEGTDVAKVVEICAQVAADVAHEVPSREVHQLRGGRSGHSRVRASDGAQGWRCALQVNSPSARRLHWWRIPGPHGATIEFANADVHDEFDITE